MILVAVLHHSINSYKKVYSSLCSKLYKIMIFNGSVRICGFLPLNVRLIFIRV